MTTHTTNILIVGGGPAGILAGLSIKNSRPKTEVLVVKDEQGIIIRCSEPYVIGNRVKLKEIVHSEENMFTKNGIDYLTDRIISIKGKEAKTQTGKKIRFKKLILATGATPFIPPINGIKKAKNVFTLRNAQDCQRLRNITKKGSRVAIIGGGAIGIETAALLKQKGCQVTILEVAKHLMSGGYDDDFAKKIEQTFNKNKITLKLNAKILEIRKNKIITSREKIPFDLIIVACGVRAETKLAAELGCKIGKFGIQVNRFCETSVKNIYACGDCSQSLGIITKKPVPSQLATTAVLEGKIAGKNSIGQVTKFVGVANPAVSAFFDYAVGRVGLTEKQAKVEKIETIVGYASSLNKYPSQKGAEMIENKLIFNKKNQTLIGAQIFGGKEGVDERIDLLSFAIHKKAKIGELAQLNYCAHPELTPLPFAEPIVMAAENALTKVKAKK